MKLLRRAYFDVNWLLNAEGLLQGISLGYDRCGEQQRGIAPIHAMLGISQQDFPMGVEGRQARAIAPGALMFQEFPLKPSDKRRKAYPAAVLVLKEGAGTENRSGPECIDVYDLEFRQDPDPKNPKPDYDLVVSWTHKGLAIAVRGEVNIARLRELHEAFLNCDIAVDVRSWHKLLRGGLGLSIPTRMPLDVKADILARDQDNFELSQAADATGIEQLLKAAGKGWNALSPSWFDNQKDEILFFLNPHDQRRHNHGWFSLAELKQWAQDTGPVMRDERLVDFAKKPEHYDWSYRLLRGMQAVGVQPRHHEHLVWVDDAKTIPGIKHRATRATESLLPSGVYPFTELMDKYATPLEAKTPA